jgi:hypothetical protein
MVMSDTNSGSAKARFRSPPYPALPLSKAIERAKQLYAKALHHSAGPAVLGEAWGFRGKSSGLWATVAALIHYGLVKDEGSGDKRKFTLTDIAMRIIRDSDLNSEKRKQAIARAAISPRIHSELLDKFGANSNVSDLMIRNYLILDRADEGKAPFSDQSADEVIRIYRDTMAYAGVADSGSIPNSLEDIGDDAQGGSNGDDHNPASGDVPPPPPPLIKNKRVKAMEGERELTTGLLSKGASFRLIVTGHVGEKEIERLIKKLELDKEILAESSNDDEDEDSEAAN